MGPIRRALAATTAAAVLTTTVLVVSTATAGACTCAARTDQEAFDAADVVFEATVVDVLEGIGPDDPAVWSFAVTDVYKGRVRQAETVHTNGDDLTCGLTLSGDGPAFVFARWITADDAAPGYPIGGLRADQCGGSRTVADTPLDLDPAVEPVAPIATASTTTTIARPATGAGAIAEPATSGGNVFVVGFIAVGVVGAFVAARLARRSRET